MRYRVLVASLIVTAAGAAALWLEPSALGWNVAAQTNPADPRAASFIIDCSAGPKPISPLIYGIGGSDNAWSTGTTAVRHGGNPTSRYNWELDTWNAANDWYFKNAVGTRPREALPAWVAEARRRGVKATITVPMLGWVAKDGTSYSFPASVFGQQKAHAPEQPDAGNGVAPDGKPISPGSPTRTSVRSTPDSIERLVRHLRETDPLNGRSVEAYILDNEPMLWHSTHRDVHPDPTTYDELLEKTIAYASAIKKADPDAKIAGPAEWGWLAYHYSAKDTVAGVGLRPDRRQHGDVPLIPWYLRNLRQYERRNGIRLLDILDVHFYPMGDGIMGGANGGATDPDTSARRLRSTRSLWDPTYRDESWINERMQVLPLLRRWIAENAPGVGISIGEWDFGAPTHMSGGLATAEALGRFGVEGVTSAYRWGSPAEKSPAFWAFRAFRNFDGKGGRFLDWSLPVQSDGTLVSLFASRDERGRQLVAVLLNLAPQSPVGTEITLKDCGSVALSRGFSYTGDPAGFEDLRFVPSRGRLVARVPPYSINIIDVTTAAGAPGVAPPSSPDSSTPTKP